MKPAKMEPATFRFVAQHLNHCATAVTKFNTVVVFITTARLSSHTEIYQHDYSCPISNTKRKVVIDITSVGYRLEVSHSPST